MFISDRLHWSVPFWYHVIIVNNLDLNSSLNFYSDDFSFVNSAVSLDTDGEQDYFLRRYTFQRRASSDLTSLTF